MEKKLGERSAKRDRSKAHFLPGKKNPKCHCVERRRTARSWKGVLSTPCASIHCLFCLLPFGLFSFFFFFSVLTFFLSPPSSLLHFLVILFRFFSCSSISFFFFFFLTSYEFSAPPFFVFYFFPFVRFHHSSYLGGGIIY